MQVTTTQNDLLAHIPTNEGMPDTVNLVTLSEAQATTSSLEGVSGSYKFFGFLEVDYALSITPPQVKVDLLIDALGKKVRIAGVDLNPNHPTAKIGGSAFGFKAEVVLSFDFTTHILKIEATGCVPIIGCKKGSTQIHL